MSIAAEEIPCEGNYTRGKKNSTPTRRTRCDGGGEGREKERKRKGERNDYALVPSSLRFDSNSAARAREQLLQVVALATTTTTATTVLYIVFHDYYKRTSDEIGRERK